MSASFQAMPSPGPPPPSMTNPSIGSSGEVQGSSHSSNGLFGMVFIVLAVILVISAIACVLGRFCNKRSHRPNQPRAHKQSHENRHNHHYNHNQNHVAHHNGGGYPRDQDLEFAFQSKEGDMNMMPGFEPRGRGPNTARVANHGDPRVDATGRGMEHQGQHGEFP